MFGLFFPQLIYAEEMIEEEPVQFKEAVFNRDLTQESRIHSLFINEDKIDLKTDEFEQLVDKADDITDILELKQVLLQIINTPEIMPYAGAARQVGNSSKYFPWGNWQKNSIVNHVSILTPPPKIAGLNRWSVTIASKMVVNKVEDTVPIMAVDSFAYQVVNASNIANPQWNIKMGNNNMYYNYNRTKRAPIRTPGVSTYGQLPMINDNRRFIRYWFPGRQKINLQSNKATTVTYSTTADYSTPARNGFNNTLEKPLIFVLTDTIHPQIVKSIHVDRQTGKVLKRVTNHGINNYYGNQVTVSKEQFAGYNYDGLEVITNKNKKITSNNQRWQGNLNEDKRGIVFYYKAIPPEPPKKPDPPKPKEYQVIFDSRGGSAVSSQKILEKARVNQPKAPTYSGKRFMGWYEDTSLTKVYQFNQPVVKNITLYAKWRSDILDPTDGKTPVTPVKEKQEKLQNKTTKDLRIQYVSDFDFGKVTNTVAEIKQLAQGDYVKTSSGLTKEVPAFISIIDDRPGKVKGWRLSAEASPFVTQKNDHQLSHSNIYLSPIKAFDQPNKANQSINISQGKKQIINHQSSQTGSFSYAFGGLNQEKGSTGAILNISAHSVKKNQMYYGSIDWELTPNL